MYILRLLHVFGDKSDFNKHLASLPLIAYMYSSLGSNKTRPHPSKIKESYYLNHHHHSHELDSCTYKYALTHGTYLYPHKHSFQYFL